MMRALSLHEPLHALLARPQRCRVLSCHRLAINLLLADGAVLSLLHPTLGDGPGAIVVQGDGLPNWQPHESIQMAKGWLAGAQDILDWRGATVWEPPPLPPVADRERLTLAYRRAVQLLGAFGNRAGLLPALMPALAVEIEPPAGAPALWFDLALPGIGALAAGRWREGVERLAGLGPGLTPSGDDLLCGFVCLLSRMGCSIANEVAAAIGTLPATASPPLSRQLLRWAAQGVAAVDYLAWVDLLLAGMHSEMALRRVLAHGVTSGADWAGGALLALHQILKGDSI